MLALTREVAVLTGGPGCGKSFTVRSVVELARARNAKVVARRAGPAERADLRFLDNIRVGLLLVAILHFTEDTDVPPRSWPPSAMSSRPAAAWPIHTEPPTYRMPGPSSKRPTATSITLAQAREIRRSDAWVRSCVLPRQIWVIGAIGMALNRSCRIERTGSFGLWSRL